MASVASHGERHVNPLVEQQLERQHGTSASGRQNEGNGAVGQDTFTPSSESNSAQATAQAAGIFQLTQAAPAANTPLLQLASDGGQNLSSSPSAPVGADTVDSAPTTGAANGAAAASGQQVAGTPVAQAATTAGASNVDVQGQVQALNLALAALGLSHYDIQQIDRIATVIQNFNPSAYTDLVNQFERQAQQAKQLTAPPPAANIGTEANPPAAANGSTGAAANADGAGQQGPGSNNPPLGGQIQASKQNSNTVTASQQTPPPQKATA